MLKQITMTTIIQHIQYDARSCNYFKLNHMIEHEIDFENKEITFSVWLPDEYITISPKGGEPWTKKSLQKMLKTYLPDWVRILNQ